METTYYTLTARHVLISGDAMPRAAGDERRLVLARAASPAPSGQRGKVIDLEQWRAARDARDRADRPEGDEAPRRAPAVPRRPRRACRTDLLELLSTLSVVAVTALLALRILLF